MNSFQVFQDLPGIQHGCWNSSEDFYPQPRSVYVSGTEIPISDGESGLDAMERYFHGLEQSYLSPGCHARPLQYFKQTYLSDGNLPGRALSPWPRTSIDTTESRSISYSDGISASSTGSLWSPPGADTANSLDRWEVINEYDTSLSPRMMPDSHALDFSFREKRLSHDSLAHLQAESFVDPREVMPYVDVDEDEDLQTKSALMTQTLDLHTLDTSLFIDPSLALQAHPLSRIPSWHDEGLGSSVNDAGSDIMDRNEQAKAEAEDMDYTPGSPTRRKAQVSSGKPLSPQARSKRALAPKPALQKISKKTTKSRLSCADHPEKRIRNQSDLRKHIQAQHTRPFNCTFRFAGCLGTFGSKNEWKRHVYSQHLQLGFWRCEYPTCNIPGSPRAGKGHGMGAMPSGSAGTVSHNDFNRKDLFTQHLRRMHLPKSQTPAQTQKWEEQLPSLHDRCFVTTRQPPQASRCIVDGCSASFSGPNSWEERMEHVGRHYELACMAEEALGTANGIGDQDLLAWAVAEGVIRAAEGGMGWELVAKRRESWTARGGSTRTRKASLELGEVGGDGAN
ncbi:MAG: hypothetical protein M1829_006946 [Trizodia sp. TS-e1964]|nr:MAG: hypothetical protein M1829_006946 [Trizodia sp. TS-e1964]